MIPRVIHRIWLDGDEPEWTRVFAGTWDQPGWTVEQWDEERLREELFPLDNQPLYDRAEEIAPGNEGQFRTDLARYELLYRRGGVYVDADFECLRPIDPLIGDLDCFAAWEKQDQYVNNAIMGCIPEHPFLGRLVVGLSFNVAAQLGHRPNVMTGPHYVTRTWDYFSAECYVFPEKLFYPYAYNELHRHKETFDDAYAVHHWANQRRRRNVPLKSRGANPA